MDSTSSARTSETPSSKRAGHSRSTERSAKTLGGQYGPKYVAVVELDGETRAISFGKGSGVGSRDDFFESLIAFFEREGEEAEPPRVFLKRVGQAPIIEEYTEEA